MSGLTCCFWWFLAGILLGWLLNWLFKSCCGGSCKTQHDHTPHTPQMNTVVTPPVVPKAVEPVAAPIIVAPVAAVPVAPKAAEPVVVAPVAKVYTFDQVAAKAAGFDIRNADDLTVVEGIGPKINELLNADGIKTFVQLAATAAPVIQNILDRAGPRFALAKPGTWPQQAALAAENRWAELKTLQDNLKGGV
ncbi:MAG: hypothetical protein WBP13_03405 [Methylophilaceae bacterium]